MSVGDSLGFSDFLQGDAGMNRFANQLILYGGVATSAAALFVVYLIAKSGFNLMGLYWLFIVPVGAIIVSWRLGICACMGLSHKDQGPGPLQGGPCAAVPGTGSLELLDCQTDCR